MDLSVQFLNDKDGCIKGSRLHLDAILYDFDDECCTFNRHNGSSSSSSQKINNRANSPKYDQARNKDVTNQDAKQEKNLCLKLAHHNSVTSTRVIWIVYKGRLCSSIVKY